MLSTSPYFTRFAILSEKTFYTSAKLLKTGKIKIHLQVIIFSQWVAHYGQQAKCWLYFYAYLFSNHLSKFIWYIDMQKGQT